tara:strand:- start:27691 stop:28179 length:489 start_codon:yes stop_codon:yes gene_type:complete
MAWRLAFIRRMRAVIQRVSSANVAVAGDVVGEIGQGVLVFLGVGQEDSEADADWLIKRIVKLRIFESEPGGRMDLSLRGIGGEALVISQFTLFGSLRKGNRPSFNRAAHPQQAVPLYEYFVERLSQTLGQRVPTGVFGERMHIEAHNDGPVTLVVDTKERDF